MIDQYKKVNGKRHALQYSNQNKSENNDEHLKSVLKIVGLTISSYIFKCRTN